MVEKLGIEEWTRIASRYKVWQLVIQVQRWWRTTHDSNAVLDPKAIKVAMKWITMFCKIFKTIQDAPQHFALIVHAWLDKEFSGGRHIISANRMSC